jgi:DNA-binding NtrC family response regulator
MSPAVVADRFLVARSGDAVDLATGEAVWLHRVSPAGRCQADSWLNRCAALSAFWHPNIVPLVDYGAVGRDGFFEAWACARGARRWKRRDEAAADALASAVAFLSSRGLSTGRPARRAVISLDGRPALLPGEEIGLPIEPEEDDAAGHRPARVGPTLADGPAVEVSDDIALACVGRLTDVLDAGVSGRPRTVRLDTRGREPGRLLTWAFARAARLHGYIPVGSPMLECEGAGPNGFARWRDAISGRHVLVLQVGRRSVESADAALYFLELGLSSDRPHVLLQVNTARRRSAASRGSVVREPSAEYASSMSVVPGDERAWPSGAVILRSGCRDREAAIAEAANAGRHAQAERLLRDALGSYARRHEEDAAGQSALALGRLLLVRGQPAEALRVIERAREHFNRARATDGAVCSAVFAGLASTDDGRLREAEAALRAARIAAVELSQPLLDQFAGLALARCLYWQNRPEEARDCLGASRSACGSAPDTGADYLATEWMRLERATCARERFQGARRPPSDVGGPLAVWAPGAIGLELARECLASRIALAMGDLASAGRFAAEARERAGQSENPTERAAACFVRALVFGALGDVSSVRSVADEGVGAARLAHAPLRALRLRIVLAETLQRAGAGAEATATVARLARIDRARLPKIVGLQIERVVHGGHGETGFRPGSQSMPRGVAPAAPQRGAAAFGRGVVADAIVEVLDVCQASHDESSALQRVTTILRERVRAISVTCYGRDQELMVALASDGTRTKADEVARRACDAGIPIAPTSTTSGLEAAVPVRFAGACVGAFGCRWAADVPPDWAVAGGVLAAASAAVAPCVRSELDRRAAPSAPADGGSLELVGVSDALQGLRREIERAARAPFHVVIEGESGCGKELVARAIHRLGPRRHALLCALNCAALADDLVEAELFGHARGAFTGAVAERKGLFEEADGGVLVLDEVGELSARAQAKVLRAIQEGEVRRVGENVTRTVDVRIIAATNRPLRAAVEAGVFRRDLLYRLEVIRILVPPLRSRPDDIPVLAAHFWRQFAARVQSRCTLAPETVAALARYDWPGNVRELQNVMAALAAAVGSRGSVGPGLLPAVIAGQSPGGAAQNLYEARRTFEARFVRAALARAGGQRARAAGDLGLTRQGLAKLMARLGIE